MLPLASTARTSAASPTVSATGPVYVVHEPPPKRYSNPGDGDVVGRRDGHRPARDERGGGGRDRIRVVERRSPTRRRPLPGRRRHLPVEVDHRAARLSVVRVPPRDQRVLRDDPAVAAVDG